VSQTETRSTVAPHRPPRGQPRSIFKNGDMIWPAFMLISTIGATPRSMSSRPQFVCKLSRSRTTYHPILFPCLARMTWFHFGIEIHKGTPVLAAAPRQCRYHWPSSNLDHHFLLLSSLLDSPRLHIHLKGDEKTPASASGRMVGDENDHLGYRGGYRSCLLDNQLTFLVGRYQRWDPHRQTGGQTCV